MQIAALRAMLRFDQTDILTVKSGIQIDQYAHDQCRLWNQISHLI